MDPLSITAFQYDLVCNGVELSSGAVRNHDPEIMIEAFQLVRLGEDDVKAKFPAMYNAFTYGAPPHAGIAPGVDRMVMLLSGEGLHPGGYPLPMNKNAQDLMMGAPSFVDPKQLDELNIVCTRRGRDCRIRPHKPSPWGEGAPVRTLGRMRGTPRMPQFPATEKKE